MTGRPADAPASATPSSRNPLATALDRWPFVIVDGAMATELERAGYNLNDGLWSARILRDDPDAIRRVHLAYFEAGADIAITASYQATREGFMRLGVDVDEADALIRQSVTLARQARDEFWAEHGNDYRPRPLVAASVGPYGAYLADGSEYRGDYGLDRAALADFHRLRVETLLAAGPDLLAVETLPSLEEAQAVVDVVETFPDARAWITFSAKDGHHISDGTPIAECAAALHGRPGVCAIGINCIALGHVETLIAGLREQTDLPVVVYPNSGEQYDPVSKRWHRGCAIDGAPSDLADGAERWLAAGARAIGGCCRTGPADIRALAARRQQQMRR